MKKYDLQSLTALTIWSFYDLENDQISFPTGRLSVVQKGSTTHSGLSSLSRLALKNLGKPLFVPKYMYLGVREMTQHGSLTHLSQKREKFNEKNDR